MMSEKLDVSFWIKLGGIIVSIVLAYSTLQSDIRANAQDIEHNKEKLEWIVDDIKQDLQDIKKELKDLTDKA